MSEYIQLTDEQIAKIDADTARGTKDHWKAYAYIHGLIKDRSESSDGRAYWFEKASETNKNDPQSAANTFIRAVTVAGHAHSGDTTNPQELSDRIGRLCYR